LQEAGADLEWILAIPQEVSRPKQEQEREQQAAGQLWRTTYSWEHRLKMGSKIAEIEGVDLVVINPAVVHYNEELGLRLEAGGDLQFMSPIDITQKQRERGAD